MPAFTSVTNPVWINAAHTGVCCTVQFEGFAKPIQFVATASDVEPHGAAIWASLNDERGILRCNRRLPRDTRATASK
jgi:hypothetical protein